MNKLKSGFLSLLGLVAGLAAGYGYVPKVEKTSNTLNGSHTKKGPGRVSTSRVSYRTRLEEQRHLVGDKKARKAAKHRIGVQNGLTFQHRYGRIV